MSYLFKKAIGRYVLGFRDIATNCNEYQPLTCLSYRKIGRVQ